MNEKYKKFVILTCLIGLTLSLTLLGSKKVLAQDINYSNFKNAVYNFLNEQCPPSSNFQCPSNSIFYEPGAWTSDHGYSKIQKYKTDLYKAKTDEEIKKVLGDFFSEYCNAKYTSSTTNQAAASSLNFLCNCWDNPNDNCKNIINSIGKQFPPGSTSVSGPLSITNLITNYEAGKELGKKFQEDKSCQADLNIGLLDFFHNPLTWFLRVIFWIFTLILKIVADIFIWILTPANFGGFVNFPPVQIIWKTSRDLANLGIVLGFVLVAIATILKIEKYSWEKMLWRLVLVALLINFSLVLCGMFVDLSNFLTFYFISGAESQVFTFKDILVNVATNIACKGYNQGFLYESGTALIGIFVVIIFIGQVAGLVIYTTLRIVTLWITLGLSPLFLLSLAFPGLEKLADSWKNYFTQAIVSLPVIALSLFFVLVMLNNVALYFNLVEGGFSQVIISLVSFAIIVIILAQAILAIAGALGIQNIQKGYQVVTKLVWGALGFGAGLATRKIIKDAINSETWRKLGETFGKSNFTIIRSLGESMQKITEKTREGQLKILEAKAAQISNDDIRRNIDFYMRHRRRREVAILLKELIKREKISNEDENAIKFAKDYINPPELKKINPYLYVKQFEEQVGRKEDRDQILNETKEKNNEYYNRLLAYQVEQMKQEDLIKSNWSDILNNIKTNQGQEKLLDVLKQLTDRLTPEAMSAIARSLSLSEQRVFIQNIIEANKEEAAKYKMTAEEYLLEKKGYKSLRYFQGVLSQASTGSKTPPGPNTDE